MFIRFFFAAEYGYGGENLENSISRSFERVFLPVGALCLGGLSAVPRRAVAGPSAVPRRPRRSLGAPSAVARRSLGGRLSWLGGRPGSLLGGK